MTEHDMPFRTLRDGEVIVVDEPMAATDTDNGRDG